MLRIAVSVAACPLSASRNTAIAQKVHPIADGFLQRERVTGNFLSGNVANNILLTLTAETDRQPARRPKPPGSNNRRSAIGRVLANVKAISAPPSRPQSSKPSQPNSATRY